MKNVVGITATCDSVNDKIVSCLSPSNDKILSIICMRWNNDKTIWFALSHDSSNNLMHNFENKYSCYSYNSYSHGLSVHSTSSSSSQSSSYSQWHLQCVTFYTTFFSTSSVSSRTLEISLSFFVPVALPFHNENILIA